MKWVFGMFDEPSSAAEAMRKVESYAKVRRLGAAENLHAFGLNPIEEKHFADGLRRGSVLVVAEADDKEVSHVERDFREIPMMGSYSEEKKGLGGVVGEKARALKEEFREKKEAVKAKLSNKEEVSTSYEEQSVPVIEEQLLVGKREVDRGGVRILTHVFTKPVDESIWLRDEEIEVERRAVHRPILEGEDRDQSIEMRATGEEAVVQKKGEVVEEVVVRKRDRSHTQEIHDSVKHTEVEVKKDEARPSRPLRESRPSVP